MVQSDAGRRVCDVLVIGAGPAGLAAAKELGESGIRVLVIDENVRPGGQIWRQAFSSDQLAGGKTSRLRLPDAAGASTLDPNVSFRGQTVCHGFLRGVATLTSPLGAESVQAHAVIIATGGIERVLPIPGWTTPGVMTAGAAQTFLKGSGSFPYRQVLVAGSGPLLLAAAAQLATAGVGVSGVVEATHFRSAISLNTARLMAAPRVLAEGAQYIQTLRKAGIPIFSGTGVARIDGTHSVSGALLRRLNRRGAFTDGSEARFVACESVLLSHGFSSSFEIASQLGARIIWDERRQTWMPQRDAEFFTTIENVQAVGDCAGVGGVRVSSLEGTIAGIAMASTLKRVRKPKARLLRLRYRLARLEDFRVGMDNLFRVGDGAAASWSTPDTSVCRCQGTSMHEVERALANGISDLRGLKLWTRAGMGVCQGRLCTPTLTSILAKDGQGSAELHPPSSQFPTRPLPGGVFARELTQFSGRPEKGMS